MINRTILVKELREKISKTSIVNMGSLNQSHPPYNSNCHQIRQRAARFQMTRVYWEKWAFHVMEREKTKMDVIESRAKTLWEILEGEGANLGYALRRHNAKMHQAQTPNQTIIIQNVLEDWVSMRYDLPLERTAAVVHLQTMLMASAMLHEYAWMGHKDGWLPGLYDSIYIEQGDWPRGLSEKKAGQAVVKVDHHAPIKWPLKKGGLMSHFFLTHNRIMIVWNEDGDSTHQHLDI